MGLGRRKQVEVPLWVRDVAQLIAYSCCTWEIYRKPPIQARWQIPPVRPGSVERGKLSRGPWRKALWNVVVVGGAPGLIKTRPGPETDSR
ncbi:hypothetical protein EYF80_015215 [Liparis tanakae]|uniref:Uncharacterized protein n=1 Tax=Liparis tanakae TaxID=230148 RepID=A0A4Z2I9M5_9TELE|nr:hypothetical protein EYF80_015215 [Liparis tanakae]